MKIDPRIILDILTHTLAISMDNADRSFDHLPYDNDIIRLHRNELWKHRYVCATDNSTEDHGEDFLPYKLTTSGEKLFEILSIGGIYEEVCAEFGKTKQDSVNGLYLIANRIYKKSTY